jgi:hypothetical protein
VTAAAYALRSSDIAHPDEGVDCSLLPPCAGRIEDIAPKDFDDDDARKVGVQKKPQPELDDDWLSTPWSAPEWRERSINISVLVFSFFPLLHTPSW